MTVFTLPDWPCVLGGPSGTGILKAKPEDFVVEEILGFEPEGSGEHVFLYIEKIGENTEYVARLLARHAGVRQRDIGYAGLKDRHGRTRQWFSVWLPGAARKQEEDPDWAVIESETLKILTIARHARKLRRGVLSSNRFEILIRNWRGDRAQIEGQLERIKTKGFPNYFGEQRFGHQGRNVEKAMEMFRGAKVKREQRSIYLSAARSYLFNLILSERVKAGTWDKTLPGEVFKLNNSNSLFRVETIDQSINERLESGDIHPTGLLYGKGADVAGGEVVQVEQRIVQAHQELAGGLLKADLESDRRALRVIPENLTWRFDNDESLRLWLELPAGSYATAFLREIVCLPAD